MKCKYSPSLRFVAPNSDSANDEVFAASTNDDACPNEVLLPQDQMMAQVTWECPEECNKWKGAMIIILTGIFCLVPIIGLLVSAFTAVPDSEPGADGLASEESQTMRAFTMGWMFCLSFKLRRELVGVVGSSAFLEPW